MLSIIFWIIPVISLFGCISTYAIALGMDINMSMIGNLLAGLLFIVLGNYIPKSKQSYTVGIKLTWTVHSRENW